jgi:hypothetical protein
VAAYTVSRSARLRAPAADIYKLIADYERGHPRIVPPKYFGNMKVEAGGIGAGTIVTFDMHVLGTKQRARATITEPTPGRVLVETYPADGIVTTFTVEPEGASASKVTITSTMPGRAGILGWLERAAMRRFLPRVFDAELARMEQVALGADSVAA